MSSETTPTPEALDRTEERLRRQARWLVAATIIAIAGIALGGAALWQRSSDQDLADSRRDWDTAVTINTDCLARAASRADTIELGHQDFDREQLGIDDDEATIDLIESNVMGLIAFAQLPDDSTIVVNSVENIAIRRARLQERRDTLAADIADFDAKREPLDPAACPPAPAGPRP